MPLTTVGQGASCLTARGHRDNKRKLEGKSCIKKGCGEETVGGDFVIKLDTEKRAISSWASVVSWSHLLTFHTFRSHSYDPVR